MKTMQDYFNDTSYKVYNTIQMGPIEGSNGWKLVMTNKTGMNINYYLSNPSIKNPRIADNDPAWQESESYFYVPFKERGITFYRFVSQTTGGAIKFRGVGRWSGSGADLGTEIGIPLVDVSLESAGYAMPVSEIKQILNKEFPGLKYSLKKEKLGQSTVVYINIDWGKHVNIKEGKEKQMKLKAGQTLILEDGKKVRTEKGDTIQEAASRIFVRPEEIKEFVEDMVLANNMKMGIVDTRTGFVYLNAQVIKHARIAGKAAMFDNMAFPLDQVDSINATFSAGGYNFDVEIKGGVSFTGHFKSNEM